jgi:type VI secretion system protein
MALRLQMTSRHRQSLGERAMKEFGRKGGTIGRSLESDWVLPDGQRYISSRHASIDYRSGSFYIVDTSTNGVYVNDAETPVGRGNPQRLFSGDRIRLGEYEMVVEIDEEENTMETLANSKHVDPVARAQRVNAPDPTGADLVPPHEITAVGIEMLISEEAETEALKHAAKLSAANLRLEEEPPPSKHVSRTAAAAAAKPASTPAPEPGAAAARKAAPARQAPPAPASAAAPAAPAAPAQPKRPAPKAGVSPSTAAAGSLLANTGSGPRMRAPAAPAARPSPASNALDAFFRGAGIENQKLDERQVEAVLHLLGQLMREVIVGLGENLHVRTEQKNVLRIPNTTIQPQANNPLKFAAGVEEALQNLFFRQPAEYMPAVDAVREAFIDVKVHQESLLNALKTALVDYVGRLDPDELENKFTNGKRGGLMSAAHKLKYWDLYKDLFQVVTQQIAGQFPQLFVDDLARAYEHESAKSGGSHTRKPQSKLTG